MATPELAVIIPPHALCRAVVSEANRCIYSRASDKPKRPSHTKVTSSPPNTIGRNGSRYLSLSSRRSLIDGITALVFDDEAFCKPLISPSELMQLISLDKTDSSAACEDCSTACEKLRIEV